MLECPSWKGSGASGLACLLLRAFSPVPHADPRAGSGVSAACGFPKQCRIPESCKRGSADQPVRVADGSAEASQPLENEGFVSRPSRRRLESPLDQQPATRMLSAWWERGLLRPRHRVQDVPGTTSAGGGLAPAPLGAAE